MRRAKCDVHLEEGSTSAEETAAANHNVLVLVEEEWGSSGSRGVGRGRGRVEGVEGGQSGGVVEEVM